MAHHHLKIKEGVTASFSKKPTRETMEMVLKLAEAAEKAIICPMCKRTEHCNGGAGYPEGCFHPEYNK